MTKVKKLRKDYWWWRVLKTFYILFFLGLLIGFFFDIYAGISLAEVFYWLLGIASVYYIIPIIFLYIFFGQDPYTTFDQLQHVESEELEENNFEGTLSV